jgi:hypothetical protein
MRCGRHGLACARARDSSGDRITQQRHPTLKVLVIRLLRTDRMTQLAYHSETS